MFSLQYKAHTFLHSKYSFIIKIAVIFLIYTLFHIDHLENITLCMPSNKKNIQKAIKEFENLYGNNFIVHTVKKDFINDNIPILAEAKEEIRPSHQVLALRKEVVDFAGTHLPLLEKLEAKNQIIEQQNSTINRQQAIINSYKKALSGQEQLVKKLETDINGNAWRPGYKQQIAKMQHDLNRVSFELNVKKELKDLELLIAENKN